MASLLVAASCGGGSSTTAEREVDREREVSPDRSERAAYVLVFFRGEGGQGVELAVSDDGLAFGEVEGSPVLTSELGLGLTRDPSVLRGPDGRWHMTWTTGAPRSVGYASSRDLLHWSEPTSIPVMEHEDTTINAWAPELHWDPETELYSIVFASTVRRLHPSGSSEPDPDGVPYEHRLYVSTSSDLRRWSPGELLWDGEVNAIDGAVVRDDEADRSILLYKDERLVPTVRKRVALAIADGFDGPWDEGDTVDELGSWVEGPSLVRDVDDEGWLLYADRYYGDGYAMASSPDLEDWTNRNDEVVMPEGARHGTVLRVPRDEVAELLATSDDPPPPTTSTAPAATAPVAPRQPVDPSTYGTERPTGAVGGILFDLLTGQGVAPNKAVCAAEVLASRISDAELIANGIVELTDEAIAPVIAAALDCGVTQAEVDATVAAARGG